MAIRNPAWYNLNEQRPWPLDDTALLTDDSGLFLPHDIIADIHLRFPNTVGERVFMSSVSVSEHIVTATLLSTAAGFTPIASISLPRPVDIYRNYALESLYPGVNGWIVFGSGLEEPELRSYRFSNPEQSVLQLRSARRYTPHPVTSIGKESLNTALTGLVRLSAGNDLEIVKEDREIDGVVQEAIVIRLAASTEQGVRNVFDIYRGPCGQRPESRNCGSPEPIEFINNVPPDCCGNLTLEFQGCVALSKDENDCSIVLDCGFGLGQACPTGDRLPDETGRLPNEYDDLCATSVSISISLSDDDDDEPIATSYSPPSTPAEMLHADLPHTTDFEDGTLMDMSVVRGAATVATDEDSGYSCVTDAGGGINIIAYGDDSPPGTSSWTTLYKRVRTEARIRPGELGALHNAGVVVNYHPTVYSATTFQYVLSDISWDEHQFRIRRYTGSNFISEAEADVPTLSLDNKYRIDVVVEPADDVTDAAWVTATLTGIDDAVSVSLGPVLISEYRPDEGNVGLFSNRSETEFTYIQLDNVPVV